ncbi:DUF2971 domain-containing protein [Anaerocolumna sp. AGMB13025]|uniref:DUF2971 domain-containing protein n=1 Tax=Anaerocolumna sp. AGMB13025 TaxID=3039116 RepID=UPI00241F5F0E|nr:DUF2971 domain-containing protein [Anaerocolumna sp. AGMB13025]WFR57107.1 DUF2971 domain-containing protein [Anaerocolumna sp. AGMB13025]
MDNDKSFEEHLERLDDSEKIYHYTSANALKNIIIDNELWVTHGNFLNDYSEVTYIYKIILKVCQDIMKNNNDAMKLYKMIMKKHKEDHDWFSQLFILSFSTNSDSLTLWSEFSNFYGYNLEFNIGDIRSKLDLEIIKYECFIVDGKVIYDEKRQIEILKNDFNLNWDALVNENNGLPTINNMFRIKCKEYEEAIDNFVMYIATELLLYAPYFKSEKFKEEQEYRFCFYYDEKDKSKYKTKRERHPAYSDNIEFRERSGSIIPYIKVNLKHDGINIPINRIMIGAKNNTDTSLTGTEFFLMKNGYENTVVVRSEITLRY